MTLLDYLALPHRWQWGLCDCTLFVGDWVKACTGRDPGEGLRGAYFTADEANRIVDRAGGMERFIAARLEPLGFARTAVPVDGDVGLITTPTGTDGTVKTIPAIRFGPLWALMSARGAMVKQVPFTGAAWRIS